MLAASVQNLSTWHETSLAPAREVKAKMMFAANLQRPQSKERDFSAL